jgi:cytochrome b
MSLHASPEAVRPIAQPAAEAATAWDPLLRAFHWALLVAVAAAIATGLAGGAWMSWHAVAGEVIAGLLVFRLTWGLWGGRHARFAQFWPTPGRVLSYLRGCWHGEGHNPLGALSVLAVLALLAAQVTTGLLGNDEIGFTGPWSGWVSEDCSLWLTGWHRWASNLLFGWISLHVLAIGVHVLVKRKPLLRAMFSLRLRVAPREGWSRALALVSLALAVAVALLLGRFHLLAA